MLPPDAPMQGRDGYLRAPGFLGQNWQAFQTGAEYG